MHRSHWSLRSLASSSRQERLIARTRSLEFTISEIYEGFGQSPTRCVIGGAQPETRPLAHATCYTRRWLLRISGYTTLRVNDGNIWRMAQNVNGLILAADTLSMPPYALRI